MLCPAERGRSATTHHQFLPSDLPSPHLCHPEPVEGLPHPAFRQCQQFAECVN
ncbi:MAG: hypothetical protein IPJ03_18025 [Ignavibacteriales bacterium]|nr:hypothetical protein [Ignavibacteriales bacterium]